ncbi:MAG: mechanosensitive ion channel family protein, partial [Pseudomonadota bacterium]
SSIVQTFSFAWLAWTLANGIIDAIVHTSRVEAGSLNAGLLRLGARVLGAIAIIFVAAGGADRLGLPVFSVLAGLGIGGLAVALAIRPTLENLIGGVILLIDKPVRLGDFCEFGEFVGTVENIGIRSTKVRKMDRTLITVPNAKLADMEITNFARADKMMIQDTIGLRYETSPDQLRYVLVKLREMFHAHPKIDTDTIRVRLKRYGDSSIDLEIRVYALTREWNEFYAIREDALLRAYAILDESGTGFAFPSQTVYLTRDGGLKKDETGKAERTVANWRKRGALPFPRLTRERIDALKGTLDYPPRGSADIGAPPAESFEERLSDPEEDEEQRPVDPIEHPEKRQSEKA